MPKKAIFILLIVLLFPFVCIAHNGDGKGPHILGGTATVLPTASNEDYAISLEVIQGDTCFDTTGTYMHCTYHGTTHPVVGPIKYTQEGIGYRDSVPYIDHIPRNVAPISVGYTPQWGCVFHGQALQGTLIYLPGSDPEVCDGLDNDGDGEVDEFCQDCASKALSVGQPIDMSTGNAYHTVEVFKTNLPGIGLDFNLFYNSRINHNSSMGAAWSHNYDSVLIEYRNNSRIMIKDNTNNGSFIYFISTDSGVTWGPAKGNQSTLIKNSTEYILTRLNGIKQHYNLSGSITKIEDTNGNFIDFTYSNSLLNAVDDNFGNTITFDYYMETTGDYEYRNGKLYTITDPKGNVYELHYWGDEDVASQKGNLKSIIFPDGDSDPNNNPEYRCYYKEWLSGPDSYGIGITYAGDGPNLTKIARIENSQETDLYIWSYTATPPGPYDTAYQSGMYGGIDPGTGNKIRANWVSIYYDSTDHTHIFDALNRRTDYSFIST